MASLYTLTDDYMDLVMRLDEAQTEDEAAAIMTELETVSDDLGVKAEAYAKIRQNKLAEAEMYKTESQRLAQKQKAAERVATYLTERIMDSMKRLGLTDIETRIGKWHMQTNPWSCQIFDEAEVPAEFHIPQPDKIDKAAILKWFKETGEIVPGVDVMRTQGVRFK